jgi:hypothetical protein
MNDAATYSSIPCNPTEGTPAPKNTRLSCDPDWARFGANTTVARSGKAQLSFACGHDHGRDITGGYMENAS